MNKFQKSSSAITAMILVIAILISSCKKQFDQPPFQTDPALVANTTIATLKTRHTIAGGFDDITTNVIISGVVVADDKSGNLYKQIFIEDSTGGLQIALEGSSLYGTFPVGRRVFVKCQGLALSDYHNTMLLGIKSVVGGVTQVGGIPAPMIQNYLVGGSINNPVVPHVVTSSQLTVSGAQGWLNPYIGRLIQLNNYEFTTADAGKTYADTSYYKNSLDRYINTGCSATQDIDVRSSGYANFAGALTPSGHGSIVGIYAPYGTTKQMILRDTTDVHFDSTRCGGGGGGGGGGTGTTLITLAQLRALHPGTTDVTVPAGDYFIAKVISNNLNESAGTVRLEDASGSGIDLFTAVGSPVYPLGTVLSVNCGGVGVLTLFSGDLELKSVPIANISTSTATVTLPAPVVLTCAQITAQANTISSSLVKINNITSITAGTPGTTGTTYTIHDASGTITTFVRNAAGITVNTAATSVTGYASIFTTPQVTVRSSADFQ